MEQLNLCLDESQSISLKNVVRHSIAITRKKYQRMPEESADEFNEFLTVEILLEISEQIKNIALARQRKAS